MLGKFKKNCSGVFKITHSPSGSKEYCTSIIVYIFEFDYGKLHKNVKQILGNF